MEKGKTEARGQTLQEHRFTYWKLKRENLKIMKEDYSYVPIIRVKARDALCQKMKKKYKGRRESESISFLLTKEHTKELMESRF